MKATLITSHSQRYVLKFKTFKKVRKSKNVLCLLNKLRAFICILVTTFFGKKLLFVHIRVDFFFFSITALKSIFITAYE